MKRFFFFVPLALFACSEPSPPLVADYNGRTVKIQYHNVPLGDNYKGSPIYATAVETCMLDGRSEASYQGMRKVGDFAGEHSFLCL